MKYFALAALIAAANAGTPPTVGLGHGYVPANREPHAHTTKTAPSPSQTTGRVPNNAPNHGNAEELDSAREVDGAPDMTDVREPHSQIKLQDFSQIADQHEIS